MSLKSPTHQWAGRTLFAFSHRGLSSHEINALVKVGDWYCTSFPDVCEQADALEIAYIKRSCHRFESLSLAQRCSDHTALRENNSIVLVFDVVTEAPMLVHSSELVDFNQALYNDFHKSYLRTLEVIEVISTNLAKVEGVITGLHRVPHLAGTLAALVQKTIRLHGLVNLTPDFTVREQLAVRASLGKKVAVELAQEFSNFRFHLVQSRIQASKAVIEAFGCLEPGDYHQEFGATFEQVESFHKMEVIVRLQYVTRCFCEPFRELAEIFEMAEIPLSRYDELKKRCDAAPAAVAR